MDDIVKEEESINAYFRKMIYLPGRTTPKDRRKKEVADFVFHGTYDVLMIRRFCSILLQGCNMRGIYTDAKKINYIGRHLVGPAAIWFTGWRSRNKQNMNIKNFIGEFKEQFLEAVSAEELVEALGAMRESELGLNSYIDSFLQLHRLMVQQDVPETEEIALYVSGLNPDTALRVAVTCPQTVLDAVEATTHTGDGRIRVDPRLYETG